MHNVSAVTLYSSALAVGAGLLAGKFFAEGDARMAGATFFGGVLAAAIPANATNTVRSGAATLGLAFVAVPVAAVIGANLLAERR